MKEVDLTIREELPYEKAIRETQAALERERRQIQRRKNKQLQARGIDPTKRKIKIVKGGTNADRS